MGPTGATMEIATKETTYNDVLLLGSKLRPPKRKEKGDGLAKFNTGKNRSELRQDGQKDELTLHSSSVGVPNAFKVLPPTA